MPTLTVRIDEETKTVTGAKSDVTVDLKAGEYEFYCNLAQDDRCRGMKGKLVVK